MQNWPAKKAGYRIETHWVEIQPCYLLLSESWPAKKAGYRIETRDWPT